MKKWLILLPVWVFILFYLIHFRRSRETDNVERTAVAETIDGQNPEKQNELFGGFFPSKDGDNALTLKRNLSGDEMDELVTRFREKSELISPSEDSSDFSPLWPEKGLDISKSNPNIRHQYSEWELCEVEEMFFYIPSEPSFKILELGKGESMPMLGEVYYQEDFSAERRYRIVGEDGFTWGAFSVDSGASFDRRIRLSDRETYHKTFNGGGILTRVSFNSNGYVSRAQWLGKGKRVSFLAWQHTVAHRRAYLTVVASVRLKDGYKSSTAFMREFISRLDLPGKIELLSRGMRSQQVKELLGAPISQSGNIWLYKQPDLEGDCCYKINLGQDGVFRGLNKDWIETGRDPPVHGTLQWMLEKTEIIAGKEGGVGYNLGVLTEEDSQFILKKSVELLPYSEGKEWERICKVLANLAESKTFNQRCLEIVIKRFLDPELGMASAIRLLNTFDDKSYTDLFLQRAKDILDSANKDFFPGTVAWSFAGELELLFSSFEKSDPDFLNLIKEASQQKRGSVRRVGYCFMRNLEPSDVRSLSRTGLADEEVIIRRYCAGAFAEGLGNPEDMELIKSRLPLEEDAQALELLERGVANLKDRRR